MQVFPYVSNTDAIPIPLPGYSDLRTANVYAVGSGPITLIDTGPKFPGSFEYLKEHLESAGHGLEDIERIVVTHGHIDHYGMVGRIREEVGYPVPCFVHAEDVWRVVGATYREEMWTEEADTLMGMVDMPPLEVEKIRKRFAFFNLLCDPVLDAHTMEEGDTFEGEGYHLRVIHTPGHSPGTCCVYESTQKILFSGDHIIKHITPNPLFEIKREFLRDPTYQSLKAYLGSLDKIYELDVHYVFPGHGEALEDLKGIIAAYRHHHEERMERIWRALKKESRPLYHLIDDVFDFVPEGDAFLAVSELLVHLELLLEQGRVELASGGPPALYRAV